MAKETDVNDLDSVFESEDKFETNNVDESSPSNDDQDLIDSYSVSEEDYTTPIDEKEENTVSETENEEKVESEEDKTEVKEEESVEEENIPENDLSEIDIDEDDGGLDLLVDEKSDDLDLIDEKEETPIEESDVTEDKSKEEEDKSEEDVLDSMVNPEVEKVVEETTVEDSDDEDDYEEEIIDEKNVETSEPIENDESTTIVDDDSDIDEEGSINNGMGSYKDFKKQSFYRAVQDIKNRYTVDDIVNYNEKFKNVDDNANIIKEMYQNVVIEYGEFLDFSDENVRNDAWILTCGRFADLIERRKSMGLIETTIESSNHCKVKDIDQIEDPNISAIMEERKKNREYVNKYAIDRTVFAIASDYAEDTSIFEDRKAVDREFYEGPFYKVFKKVMTSDEYTDMKNVYMKVIINPDTSFIPIIDFSTGIRFVCIDSRDVDQFRIHAMSLARSIPFSFPNVDRRFLKMRVIYSDMCMQRSVATTMAIKKLVTYNRGWNKRYVVQLQHNFAIAYTTETKYIELFENGDPDSKKPENCVNISRKPKTCSIGIIAMDKKSKRDRQAMRRKQGRKAFMEMEHIYDNEEDINFNDYDVHFVLSASVICNDRSLVDPTIAPEYRMVRYNITRYCECNSVIILDGLQTICACIIKEHKRRYGPNVKYCIEFDYDPAELLSPAVIEMIDNRDGIDVSSYKKAGPMSIMFNYIMPPSRLKMDGVFDFEKGRIDFRNFNPATLAACYPRDLYSRYNINTAEGRAEFLRSRGFEEFWQPATVTFDILEYALSMIEVGDFINELQNVNISTLSDRDSGDIDNLLYQQQKLEFAKKLDNSSYSGLQKFLLGVLDYVIDSQTKK